MQVALNLKNMEIKSRIEILNEVAMKFANCSFDECLSKYNNEIIISIVLIAMNKIELQGMQIERSKSTTIKTN